VVTDSGGPIVNPDKQSNGKPNSAKYTTKKCPYCNAHMPLRAKVCTDCKKSVGDVDELGFAEKPADFLGYLITGLCIVGFIIFMWWGFFRE